MAYSASFPNSFKTDSLIYDPATKISLTNVNPNAVNSLSFNPAAFNPNVNLGPTSWTFICAPEEISWTTSNAVNRVDIFGTNSPPAISGTKGLREFTLNNALVEGFSRNKTVEAKVSALEDLLKYKSSLSGGFVNVPVYQVWANQKGYGQQAYFLLKSVQVKEKMRDLTGDSTRAYVDVSFVEVPAFQVDSGIDQAPFSQQAKNSTLLKIGFTASQTQLEAAKKGFANQGIGTTKSKSGAGAPTATPASTGSASATPSTITATGGFNRLGGIKNPNSTPQP
jgi:hypothetical protein